MASFSAMSAASGGRDSNGRPYVPNGFPNTQAVSFRGHGAVWIKLGSASFSSGHVVGEWGGGSGVRR